MKKVKELTDSLRQRLEILAGDARKAAEAAVTARIEKLKGIPGYDELSDGQRKEIDSVVDETIEQIRSQPIIAVVREAAARFESSGYTGILKKVTAWIAPRPAPAQSTGSGGADREPEWESPVEFIGLNHLKVSFDKPWLATSEDVDRYIDQLRESMLRAVSEKKRITL